jgi:predicted lysophospholipase L1 biosynthesis ABC-type transport system permease subunit
MVGAFAVSLALVVVGLILMVVVPGVGWLLGLLVVIAGILILGGAFAGGRRRRAGTAPGP